MSDNKAQKKKLTINTRIDGPITKENYHQQATIADLKASRMLTEKNLNFILAQFMQQRLQFESRFNVLWNIISSIIQFLDEKGMITVEDFARIGLELRARHGRNMAKVREYAKKKQQVPSDELEKNPIDWLLEKMGNMPAKPTLVRTDAGCEDVPPAVPDTSAASTAPTEPAPPEEQVLEGFNCGICNAEVQQTDTKCPGCGAEFATEEAPKETPPEAG